MISKTIRISQTVYDDLLNLQRPRETLSEVVDRLVQISALLVKITPLLRAYEEHFYEQKRKADELVGAGDGHAANNE